MTLPIEIPVTVIIVSYNSEQHLSKALECLKEQTYWPIQTIIVDTGSASKDYLVKLAEQKNIQVFHAPSGSAFCKGNNIGFSKIAKSSEYVFFLNPDAYLSPQYIEKAVYLMESPGHQDVGVMTGQLRGFNQAAGRPTGTYDSTGIYRKWYGKWVDRGQGEEIAPHLYACKEEPHAICGAAMFCRKKALEGVLLRAGEVFDESFFMYKEDIDLSLRLRKKGWRLVYDPSLFLFHCRGWNPNRGAVPSSLRLASARNELKIHLKTYAPIPILYSLAKYIYVRWFER